MHLSIGASRMFTCAVFVLLVGLAITLAAGDGSAALLADGFGWGSAGVDQALP